MSDFYNPDAEKEKEKHRPSYTWSEVWTAALTKPSVETFEDILSDVNASARRGLNWMIIVGSLSVVIYLVILSLQYPGYYQFDLLSLVCGTLVAGPVVMIGFAIGNGITHLFAKWLGGDGTYGNLLYAASSYTAPMYFVNIILALIFSSSALSLNILNWIVSIYTLALQAMALRAVYRFGWGKAILTIILPFVVIVGLTVFCFLTVLGPSIQEVYDSIVLTMQSR